MLDLARLFHFVTVARMGSFARAAEELHLSQPALTRSIQALESQLDTRLIERRRGRAGISLTSSGHTLAKRASEILRREEQLRDEFSGRGSRQVQRVAFGLGPLLVAELLDEVLLTTPGEEDELAVTVHVGEPNSMLSMLLSGQLDFYIGPAALDRGNTRVSGELLGRYGPQFLVRPDHPLVGRDDLEIDDIVAYPIGAGLAWHYSPLALNERVDRRLFDPAIMIDDYRLLSKLALRSDLVVIGSTASVDGALVSLPVGDQTLQLRSELYLYSLAALGIERGPAVLLDRVRRAFARAIPVP